MLNNLNFLDLDNNNIQDIPETLCQLPHLERLRVDISVTIPECVFDNVYHIKRIYPTVD